MPRDDAFGALGPNSSHQMQEFAGTPIDGTIVKIRSADACFMIVGSEARLLAFEQLKRMNPGDNVRIMDEGKLAQLYKGHRSEYEHLREVFKAREIKMPEGTTMEQCIEGLVQGTGLLGKAIAALQCLFEPTGFGADKPERDWKTENEGRHGNGANTVREFKGLDPV